MQYNELGRTGIQVSRLCLGTMTWGEQNSEDEAHSQLDRAVEAGINFIDTAEMYPVPPRTETQGLTEQYLGSWLARSGQREQLVIASKVSGPGMVREGNRLDRKNIRQAVDDSLRRLQTDYIDLYQVHWPNRLTNFFGRLGYKHSPQEDEVPIEETLAALAEQVEAGKIRHVGISNETPWGMMRYVALAEQAGLPRIVSIQNPYNLLNRTFEIGLAEIAHREDAGLLAYSPLAFGALSGKYLDGNKPEGARLTLYERFSRYTGERGQAATRDYVEIARRHNLDPAQMALAWVNSRGFLTANIIGATSMEQLNTNIASIDLALSDEVLREIEAVHERNPNPCP